MRTIAISNGSVNLFDMKNRSKGCVFIGLSGGVDSAVSATLLKRAGYDITGVFIKVWQPDWIECTWREDRRDAMRVAAHLGIPFVTLDLEKEYKESVIDYMIAEYSKGRTPNPDVMCNRTVKFGAFYDWAIAQGADFVATGHYARIVTPALSATTAPPSRRKLLAEDCSRLRAGLTRFIYSLLISNDSNKDQSYFLWTLKQEQLPRILFPIGHLTKPEVRSLARKFGLPNAEKKDSQGLCFIGKVNIKEFLSHYMKSEPGNVLDENGEVIGAHPGALFFTIGERHGFTITKKTPHDQPLYVIDKDVEQNTITVTALDESGTFPPRANRNPLVGLAPRSAEPAERNGGERESESGFNQKVRIEQVNWTEGRAPDEFIGTGKILEARTRYRQPLEKMRIAGITFTDMTVEFERKQATIAPGQSLVIYEGEKCLGGGVISC